MQNTGYMKVRKQIYGAKEKKDQVSIANSMFLSYRKAWPSIEHCTSMTGVSSFFGRQTDTTDRSMSMYTAHRMYFLSFLSYLRDAERTTLTHTQTHFADMCQKKGSVITY